MIGRKSISTSTEISGWLHLLDEAFQIFQLLGLWEMDMAQDEQCNQPPSSLCTRPEKKRLATHNSPNFRMCENRTVKFNSLTGLNKFDHF